MYSLMKQYWGHNTVKGTLLNSRLIGLAGNLISKTATMLTAAIASSIAAKTTIHRMVSIIVSIRRNPSGSNH